MGNYRKAFNFLYKLRDNGIKVDMEPHSFNGQVSYIFSIRGSAYMNRKAANKYLREHLGIEPATLEPRKEKRR